jgi:hypothetical protein
VKVFCNCSATCSWSTSTRLLSEACKNLDHNIDSFTPLNKTHCSSAQTPSSLLQQQYPLINPLLTPGQCPSLLHCCSLAEHDQCTQQEHVYNCLNSVMASAVSIQHSCYVLTLARHGTAGPHLPNTSTMKSYTFAAVAVLLLACSVAGAGAAAVNLVTIVTSPAHLKQMQMLLQPKAS